jgi:predicted membrane protein
MAASTRSHRMLVGLGFLAVGVLFLLQNLTDWEIPWGEWWPAILIVLGLWNMVRNRSWFGGAVLTIVGVFFLLDTQDIWDYTIGDIWRFWPVVLVLIGTKMLLGNRKRRRSSVKTSPHHVEDNSVPGNLNITSVFGSNEQVVTDQHLAGGQISSVFGSTDIDLRDAALAGSEAELEVTVVFGNTKIRVPSGWTVDIRVTNILGSAEDKRRAVPAGASTGRLVLTGSCVLGGLEVES